MKFNQKSPTILKELNHVAQKYYEAINRYMKHNNFKHDEILMDRIEKSIGIPIQMIHDFRLCVLSQIGGLHIEGKEITWDFNPNLSKAFLIEIQL
jgi:hypothetical protein